MPYLEQAYLLRGGREEIDKYYIQLKVFYKMLNKMKLIIS